MRKNNGIILIFFCIALIFMAGCTSTDSSGKAPVETPTPQIVYVTVLVTPSPAVVHETAAEPTISGDTELDEEFIEYVDTNQIIDGMTALAAVHEGSYSATTGYNSQAKKEAVRLTELLLSSPAPGTNRVKAFRSAMLDALSMMDGSTAGFSRYRDSMQAVTKENNALQSELHSLGLSSVDAEYLTGRGSDVRTFNVTEPGQKTFSIRHTGDSNFAVILKDENKNYISLLANEIGDFSGKKSERLGIGEYFLEITADGAWTIGIAG